MHSREKSTFRRSRRLEKDIRYIMKRERKSSWISSGKARMNRSRSRIDAKWEGLLARWCAWKTIGTHRCETQKACHSPVERCMVISQIVDKKLFSPEGGRTALSANERIAEFLDFAIQVKFAYVNKLKCGFIAWKSKRNQFFELHDRAMFLPTHDEASRSLPVLLPLRIFFSYQNLLS